MGCGKSKPQSIVPEENVLEPKAHYDKPAASNQKTPNGEVHDKPAVYGTQNQKCGENERMENDKTETANEKKRNSDVHDKLVVVKPQDETQYKKIDDHARKAPASLKNSVADLVNYMSACSKAPKMLARGFYVWLAENVRYDVEGLHDKTKRGPDDALSVMKRGKSVCEGYANVMKALCKEAGIPVKKVTGFSKGYGYAAERSFSLKYEPTHAWNAVQLDGKWYLVDSTWGAGKADGNSKTFKKGFNDFFFLTDPHLFGNTHFPYFPYKENSLEESKKWQLLDNPISIEEFSESIKYTAEGFKLGIQPVSHKKALIEMEDEIEMEFKSKLKGDVVITGMLMLKEGGWMREQLHSTFDIPGSTSYRILIRPPKAGLYKLSIFGKRTDDESEKSPELMEYAVKCHAVKEKDCTYPRVFGKAHKERVVLYEPLRGKLKAKSEVKFKVQALNLENIMVGETYLDKKGTEFSGTVKTGSEGEQLIVCVTSKEENKIHCEYLFLFEIC